jgi:hypothetical protein
MFVAANSLCWFVKPDHLYGELLALGKEFAPHWSPRKVMEHCKFVFKKFNSVTARGERMGRMLIKNETIRNRLGITPSEDRQMTVLISPEEKQRRYLERLEALRVLRREEGMLTMAEYNEKRAILVTEKRKKALELREKGLSYRQIAREMGITEANAWNLLNKC